MAEWTPSNAGRHRPSPSEDTCASGFAESAMSFSGLAHFPAPPSTHSNPSTPTKERPGYFFPSPASTPRASNAPPDYREQDYTSHMPSPLAARQSVTGPSSRWGPRPLPSTSRAPTRADSSVSPYDWHDGSSSVPMDPHEDRMLSTSFITSLLASENNRFPDDSTSAMSAGGFSDMSYPPPGTQVYPPFPSQRQPPPSSFAAPTKKALAAYSMRSGDSETLAGYTSHGKQDSFEGSAPPKFSMDSEHREIKHHPDLRTSLMSQGGPSSLASMPISTAPSRHRPRQSMHSTKTTKSSKSITSFIGRAYNRITRPKPLPPVPSLPHFSNVDEAEYRRGENAMALPALVERADVLSNLLDRGVQPHQSMISSGSIFEKDGAASTQAEFAQNPATAMHSRRKSTTMPQEWQAGPPARSPTEPRSSRMTPRKKRIIMIISVLIVLVVIGATLGVVLGTRKGNSSSNCQGTTAGAFCNLDATCTCTSTLPGRCDSLAQSLVELTPSVNELFQANFTPNSISQSIWLAQGEPVGSCVNQALLVDVGPAINSTRSPRTAEWVQSAILWTIANSQDQATTERMRQFVLSAPWDSLGESDEAVDSAPATFSSTFSGYTFDFAARKVSSPPLSFVTASQASKEQIVKVGPVAQQALDRMYTAAGAASEQQSSALSMYWKSTLNQRPENLGRLIAAIQTAPILIPFHASNFTTLMTNSSSDPFPAPLSCQWLSTADAAKVQTIETGVFGLPAASPVTASIDTNCFADRPIYGVIDLTRLRLPFLDARIGVPKQAVLLKRDVTPRVVVYSGEILSGLPGSAISQDVSTRTDSRAYGTMSQLNHVLLQYLTSIPDVNVAKALVSFIFSSPAIPPSADIALFKDLASLPALEVAVFGSISAVDVQETASSLTTSTGGLFFGSPASAALRSYSIDAVGSSVVWTESATSPKIVRDSGFEDPAFNAIWQQATIYAGLTPEQIQNLPQPVTVVNVTSSFESLGLFNPI